MDVLALQEELDAAKVARATQSRATDGGNQPSNQKSLHDNKPLGDEDPGSPSGNPPHLIEDDDTGLAVAAQPLHPHSAEFKLRQRYFVFADEIVGRGAFGEVLLAQLREAPIIGNSTFAPLSALLGNNSNTNSSSAKGQSQQSHLLSRRGNGSHAMSLCSVSIGFPSVLPSTSASSKLNPGLMSPSNSSISFSRSSAAALSISNDTPLFAIKKIDKRRVSNRGLSQLYSEVETLSLLNHQNIVKLQEVFQDQTNMFIVMEYVRGGELGKVLKRVGHFSELIARKMCLQILLAIEYIHDKGIVHRDLKPANCLLTMETVFSSSTAFHFAHLHAQGGTSSGPASPSTSPPPPSRGSVAPTHVMVPPSSSSSTTTNTSAAPPGSPVHCAPHPSIEFTVNDFQGLKLADFGFAAMVGRAECLTTYCGTMHFMAPEVVGREGVNYGKPVDMWSFGVIAYNLLSGDLPFNGANSEKLVEAICQGAVSFPPSPKTGKNVWSTVSPAAKEFIQKLLVVDPTRRLTAQDALRHPWIRAEYRDDVDMGDYPVTKGVVRAHSKWARSRTLRHRLLGACHAVVAAHRLIFFSKIQSMRRDGIGEIPVLRHLPFIVHGTFEPPNHIAAATSKKFMNNIAALKRLTEMVASSHTVEVLDVSGNNIDDLGLVQLIVKVSYAHPSLVHLNMERNPIPPLAARALLRLARSPTHKLNIINVNHTNLGIDVIAQIDGCLKETIRRRAEAAAASGALTMSSVTSPIVSSSPILRHDSGALRIGLMQSLTSTASPSAAVSALTGEGSSSPLVSLGFPVAHHHPRALSPLPAHNQGNQQGVVGSSSNSGPTSQGASPQLAGPSSGSSFRPPSVNVSEATLQVYRASQSGASPHRLSSSQRGGREGSPASPVSLRRPTNSHLPPLTTSIAPPDDAKAQQPSLRETGSRLLTQQQRQTLTSAGGLSQSLHSTKQRR